MVKICQWRSLRIFVCKRGFLPFLLFTRERSSKGLLFTLLFFFLLFLLLLFLLFLFFLLLG
jgi:hypothetical protein